MNNPYAPPNANLEMTEPSAPRPMGIKLLAILFVLFSVATTVLAYVDDRDGEWIIVFACSLVLIVLLRGVFLGREKDRKVGVFIGFFIAFLNIWGFYEPSASHVEIQRLLYASESVYAIVGALYLVKMKGSKFFR